MPGSSVLKEVNKQQCHYCWTDLELNFDNVKDEFEQDFHYKVIICSNCNKEIRIKVDFDSDGVDDFIGKINWTTIDKIL